MAINTSNNKVRIISTTVSGLATNSKFSDITSPALVVNTSEGGIFYADGSGGTTLKHVAALPNHTHSYLPLSGGTITDNLSILYGDNDKFIMWDYDGDGTAGASWRIGAKGTGSSNTNYFTIQSGTSTVNAYTWTDILNIGHNDFTVYFTQTPKVGSTKVSLEGHTHSGYATTASLENYAKFNSNIPYDTSNFAYNCIGYGYNAAGWPTNGPLLTFGANSKYTHFIHGNNAGHNLSHAHVYNGTISNWSIILDSSNYTLYCSSLGHTHEVLNSANSIIINRTSTSNPVIAYQSNGTLVGILGFDTNGKLIVSPNRSSSTNYYDVIHSGNIASQSVAAATTATTMSSFDAASSSATKRYVWMSWDDNSGKPAYSSKLTFQTSTNTLFVNDKEVSLSDHTHSNYLPKAGGTMTGKLNMNGTAYPQIFGNGTYLAFGYNSSSSQVVIDSTCLRRGSSATVSLGSSDYPWSNFYAAAATLTGALTISGTSATTSTINFTRDGYSYISSKGVFAIEPKGLASSGTTGYQFDASAFYPGVTLTYNIGTSTLGFNKIYTRYIDTAGSNYNLRFCASGTEGMNLTASKKLYVGGSTSATYTLQVNGEAYATNFITSSDKRLKTNIKEISNSEKSLELPFYEFDYKSDNRHSYGHIAQDVEEIYPSVVMHDNTDDDYLALDYTTLHSIQIKALIDEINKLKEEIRSLKASNVKFK